MLRARLLGMNERILFLEHSAYNIRVQCLKATTQAESGHPTSCLSAADIITALFFYAMKFDVKNPDNSNNDRFILSKGHAAPLLYAVWNQLGIISDEELMQLRTFNSVLEGHLTPRFSRFEAATGSLGQGLSIGLGMALSARLDKRDFYTYVLLGDSEVAEGSVWEACALASYYNVDRLIAILDINNLGQSTITMQDYHLNVYAERFAAFGWHVLQVDGHDMVALVNILDEAKRVTGKPTIILAKTIKGYGLEKIEGKNGFHGKAFSPSELPRLLQEMEKRFAIAAHYKPSTAYVPPLVSLDKKKIEKIIQLPAAPFNTQEEIATRKAYGYALAAMATLTDDVISLDAEVKNSTYADMFEKIAPERFIQCFIAEQNMIGMAVGLAARKKIPFISTFGCFLTRAFDQLRMAAVGKAPLRVVGSHAGVSIGQDGPSQMALEDIAMFRAIPDSVIFYPCDAISTYKLVEIMANRFDGITYLRTTRSQTPHLYSQEERFVLGGCKIVRRSDQDVACIVAAGITVFEALKAYEQLRARNIFVSIIDAYCIKPLDTTTLLELAKKSNNTIITVEDHYREGGLGEAVVMALKNHNLIIKCLAVDKMPRSGTPEELRRYEHIDAQAIITLLTSGK